MTRKRAWRWAVATVVVAPLLMAPVGCGGSSGPHCADFIFGCNEPSKTTPPPAPKKEKKKEPAPVQCPYTHRNPCP